MSASVKESALPIPTWAALMLLARSSDVVPELAGMRPEVLEKLRSAEISGVVDDICDALSSEIPEEQSRPIIEAFLESCNNAEKMSAVAAPSSPPIVGVVAEGAGRTSVLYMDAVGAWLVTAGPEFASDFIQGVLDTHPGATAAVVGPDLVGDSGRK